MCTELPESYYARPIRMDDAHPFAALHSAQSRWLNGVDELIDERAEELIMEWKEEPFRLETNTLAVFTGDDQAVGYAAMFDWRAPHVSLTGNIIVHPQHMRLGIGSFLADWLESRARKNLSTEDDLEMGWVQSIGVRRPWRKRGLGLALLQQSFCALYARGKKRAGLGVDASSLTGANRLYERAGMRVERLFLGFELELRAGEDRTRHTMD